MKKIITSNTFIFLAVTIATGIFYFFTVSQRLTWANYGNDGGDFLAAILSRGIPHPTGYPTYTVLGILLQNIPVGDPYFRVAMLSWLPAAISAGLLSIWVSEVLDEKSKTIATVTALTTGLAWGLMPFLWSQAVIIEVHGLQSLFLVLALWWIWILLNETHKKIKPLYFFLLSFSFGLSLGNHITIVLFLPAILFALWIAHKNGMRKRVFFGQLVTFGLGLMMYLYLPVAASQYPPINWGNPQTWVGIWWVITGNPYHQLLGSTSVLQFFTRIPALAGLLLEQFGYLGIILGVIGAVEYKHHSKNLPISLLYIFVAFSLFAILYGTDDSITYLLAPFMVITIWIGLGIATIIPFVWKKLPLGYLLFTIYLIGFMIGLPETINKINPRQLTQPADYAETLLQDLPENAILLASEDRDSFPIWYYHFGLKQRPDISIIVLPLTQFRWYQETLIRTYPDLHFPAVINEMSKKSAFWGESIPDQNPEQPVCKSSVQTNLETTISVFCSSGENYKFLISD